MSHVGDLGMLGEVFFTIFVYSTSVNLTHILQIIQKFKHLNGACSPFKELISPNDLFHLLKVNWLRDYIIKN